MNFFDKISRVNRHQGGSILILSIALIIVLVLVGMAAFQISLVNGGYSELSNAVESGNLNVAMSSLTRPNVRAQGGAESQIAPLGLQVNIGTPGAFSVWNINRAWGQALIVAMNAQAMQDEGSGTSLSTSHAQDIVDAAHSLSTRLGNSLKSTNTQQANFTGIASSNNVRMLGLSGQGSRVQRSSGLSVSYVHRNGASNMWLKAGQIPSGLSKDMTSHMMAIGSRTYLLGYQPINLCGRDIFFVPLYPGRQPALIDLATFDQNVNPDFGWANAVPNAFSFSGSAQVTPWKAYLGKRSAAVVEPIIGDIEVSVPWFFLRIENNTNQNATPWALLSSHSVETADILDRVRQRIRQGHPQFDLSNDHSQTRSLLSSVSIPPGQNAFVYSQGPSQYEIAMNLSGATTYLASHLSQAPDGVAPTNLIVNTTGPNYRYTFIPCSGYNFLSAVLRIQNN
jgi:hypothetical protein